MKKNKIIVFVKNKLITLDTVLPILIEMKEKYNINNTIKLNSWKVCIENLLAIIKEEDR